MDRIEIRAPREEEFHAVVAVDGLAFGMENTEEDERAYRLGFPFDRALCAFEDGRMVATSAVLSMELTIPGRVALPAGGVTWAATLPTHRRRGLLRRLLAAHFADMAARGEPVSTLLASEGNIYGRFGYGPATSALSFSVERPYAALATPLEDTGRLVLLDAEDAAAQLPAIYEGLRLSRPGAVSRSASWWHQYLYDPPSEREGATGMYHVKHETEQGIADGYVSYRLKEQWAEATPVGEVRVVELFADDPTAYRALWDYVLDTDLCRTVTCWRGRVDEPLRWLLADPRHFEVKALWDELYLRLLDVPRALAARAYRAEGELVLEVRSEFPVQSESRFLLSTGPAGALGAECSRTTRAADLALSVEYLGAAYLGGVSFTALATAGRLRELTAGAVERADAMFHSSVAPFCATMF